MSLFYRWWVSCLKVRSFNIAWRHWKARRGYRVGAYHELPSYIRQHAPGGTFADVGCMWGVNGVESRKTSESCHSCE